MPDKFCVLIPAYCPTDSLVSYVGELYEKGIRDILVVNDGSGKEYGEIFEKLKECPGCQVIGYGENRGKGAALKFGFEHIMRTKPDCGAVITADCDGQHTPEDVMRTAEAVKEHPDDLVLGVRDFSVAADGSKVPLRSRFGNTCSSGIFFLLFHRHLGDTQTGLRGFSSKFLPFMCEISGSRYEYEIQVLIACVRERIPFFEIPISTVYENDNAGSHFRPLQDSSRIMAVMFREFFLFISSSLLSAAVDIAGAWFLMDVLRLVIQNSDFARITAATVGARLVSMWVNYTLNRKLVFQSRAANHRTMARYVVLCAVIMVLSSLFVYVTSQFFGLNEKLAKVVGDCLLFFLSYKAQKGWVFRS